MHLKCGSPMEPVKADATFVRFFPCVCQSMDCKVSYPCELFNADITLMRFVSHVYDLRHIQAASSSEHFRALPLVVISNPWIAPLMKRISVLRRTTVSILRLHLIFIRISLLFKYKSSFASSCNHTAYVKWVCDSWNSTPIVIYI
jgi:hypothetical protein